MIFLVFDLPSNCSRCSFIVESFRNGECIGIGFDDGVDRLVDLVDACEVGLYVSQ